MTAAGELSGVVGMVAACAALGLARATAYRLRHRSSSEAAEATPLRPSPPRALRPEARRAVLDELHTARFVDQAPREVYATLLDEGTYLCSVPTMSRLLRAASEVRERRDQLRHPTYPKPELLATRPNEVGSWDITKRLGPATWTYVYLYVILDRFSRYVVGWMLAHRERARASPRTSSARHAPSRASSPGRSRSTPTGARR